MQDPNYGWAWSRRGVAWWWKGDLTKAIAGSTKAIQLNPADELAWYTRGCICEGMGQLDMAISDLDRSVGETRPACGELK